MERPYKVLKKISYYSYGGDNKVYFYLRNYFMIAIVAAFYLTKSKIATTL